MALLLILIAGLFGRVIIYAATGRWLQRKFLKAGRNSESVALLLGTSFWITLSSLPYVWPFVVAVVLVTSLGLALTARYRVGWRASGSLVSFKFPLNKCKKLKRFEALAHQKLSGLFRLVDLCNFFEHRA